MKHIFIIFSFCLLSLHTQLAFAESTLHTSAEQAIVLDYDTGIVLFHKNAEQRMPTSSMSKVITAYVVFEALKSGAVSLDDKLLVSEKAWRKGGSKMFVEVGDEVKVEDLIRGVIIQSGNDATIVLAEGLAGSEEAFADKLNSTAQKLGMKNSHFMNASGWPDPDHYSTAMDLAILARALIQNFPDHYHYYAAQEFTYNNITQKNRNPLLYRNIGADGIKTGHTEAGGYGLIGSGVNNGRRVIVVVNGLKDEKARAQESAKLLEWGLKRFESRKIFAAGQEVQTASVSLGQNSEVPAVLPQDLNIAIPKLMASDVKAYAKFKEPLVAPIKKGQEIGTLRIEVPLIDALETPLYAGEAVKKKNFFTRAFAKAALTFKKSGQVRVE